MPNIWPIIAILLIEIVLFTANYIPGTYLLGWDNIMPEFNIPLNFKRSLFSVWQDYRGLGVADGLSHAANLTHTAYISLLSIVLPQNLLRYAFILLIHLAGGIGMYFLLKKLLTKANGQLSIVNCQLLSLIGALFYMFNLGVVQMFYAPLEVFVVHFAALPIFTLSILNTLKNPSRRNLFILLVLSVATSAQGFVPTLFIVFMILFVSFLVVDFFESRDIKKIIIIAFTIFAANAFWLLPYSYTVTQNAKIIQGTRINQFSSEEIFYRNRAQADIINVLSFKGFMLDSIEYDSKNNINIFFMEQWRNHLDQIHIQLIIFISILIMLLGLAYVIARIDKRFFAYLISMGVSFVFLANNTPLFAQLNDAARSLFPVLSEALRFPFTKFIILFVFCFSIFFVQGLYVLIESIQRLKFKILSPIFYSLIAISLFLIAFPAFRGYFFSPLLKVELPNEYKDVFSFFSTQDDQGRIAILPSYTFWNWRYRNWGHIGSGFLWYGIEQPLLDRAFDPWSFYNEQFYNEFSYAINRNDNESFNQVLQKYNIKYLLVDKSIQNSVSRGPIDYASLESFLNSNETLQKEHEKGSLSVYNVTNQKSNFYLVDEQNMQRVFPGFHFANQDVLYKASHEFVADDKSPDSVFILPSLYTGKLQDDVYFEAEETNNSAILRPKEVFADVDIAASPTLVLPSLFVNELLIPVEVAISGSQIVFSPIYPTILINDRTYSIQDEKIVAQLSRIINPSSIEFVDTKNRVDFVNGSARGFILNNHSNIIKVTNDLGREETIAVNTENINKASYSIPIPSEKINKLEIVISKFDNSLAIQNLIQNELYEIKYKLDPLNIFPSLARTQAQKQDMGILLSSRGSSSVDLSFYLDTLPHPGSYIMFVDSEYWSGLPTSFYAENTLRDRPEVETKLSKTKDKNVIIVPPTESDHAGYGFHFTVKSQGIEEAASVLKNISLFPIPESTIENMKILLNKRELVSDESTVIMGNKINASLYSLNIAKDSKSKYLVFSQSHDPGWRAYEMANNSEWPIANSLKTALPFLFGDEIKEHVEVNSWANGWLLPANSQQLTANSQIIIVYLPQYLEYVGFAILAVTFGILLGRFLFLRGSA